MTTIQNHQSYLAAMQRIEELLPLVDDSTPLDDKNLVELDLLSGLVSDYEDEHYPIAAPTLVEVMKLRMEEMGLTTAATADLIGTTTDWLRDFYSGKSEPTFSTARNISRCMNIDGNIVLGAYA